MQASPAEYNSAIPEFGDPNLAVCRLEVLGRRVLTSSVRVRWLGGRNCLMAEPYGFTFYTAGETPALISANLDMPPSYHG